MRFHLHGRGNHLRSGILLLIATGIVNAPPALNLRATSVETVEAFLGTRNAKLVFWTKEAGLLYIDYSATQQGEPVIRTIAGTTGARFPVISPDGRWITYATGATQEYSQQISTAWMQELSETAVPVKVADTAYVPRFKQNAANPTIIYSTRSLSADWKRYTWQGYGMVFSKEWTGNGWRDSLIWDKGSYLGGLSWDNRYLAHAEQKLYAFLLDLENGGNGPAILHCLGTSVQVCNASVSSSRIVTDAVMYFDFGAGNTPLGSWALHKRFFISRHDGSVLRYYDVPAEVAVVPPSQLTGTGEVSDKRWNFPEWSNHPYFGVASIEVARSRKSATAYRNPLNNEKVYAVNLQDSLYLRLVEATDTSEAGIISMSWPWLWVEVAQGFSEDPQWLTPPRFTPTAVCTVAAVVDTGDTSVPPPDTTKPPRSDGKRGCGSGLGLALLPPIAFRVFGRRGTGRRT